MRISSRYLGTLPSRKIPLFNGFTWNECWRSMPSILFNGDAAFGKVGDR